MIETLIAVAIGTAIAATIWALIVLIVARIDDLNH